MYDLSSRFVAQHRPWRRFNLTFVHNEHAAACGFQHIDIRSPSHAYTPLAHNVYVRIIWLRRQCSPLSCMANATEVHCSCACAFVFRLSTSKLRASPIDSNPSLQLQQRFFFNVSKVGHFRLTGSLVAFEALLLNTRWDLAEVVCVYVLKSVFHVGEIAWDINKAGPY